MHRECCSSLVNHLKLYYTEQQLPESVVVLTFFLLSYAAPSPVHNNEMEERFYHFSHFLLYWRNFFPFFLTMWRFLCCPGEVLAAPLIISMALYWQCVTRHGLSSILTPPQHHLPSPSESWCWSKDVVWAASFQILLSWLHKYGIYLDY